MFELPKTTEYNKRIPKQKFYENMEISPTLKKAFIEQVNAIYWRNKIATSTTNLAEGKEVIELEVFEVRLHGPNLEESLLRQIDRVIPYHILFLLEYHGKYQAWISYKETSTSGRNAFKVNDYYHTEWLVEEDLSLKLEGLNMDAVYENLVCQIAGDKLNAEVAGESLKESVTREGKKRKLLKQIDSLSVKIRKEKQMNRQVEMRRELKKLKKKLEDI